MQNENFNSVIGALNILEEKLVFLKGYKDLFTSNDDLIMKFFKENKINTNYSDTFEIIISEMHTKYNNENDLLKIMNLVRMAIEKGEVNSDQYMQFLRNEFVDYNWQSMYYTEPNYYEMIKSFLNNLKLKTVLNSQELEIMRIISEIISAFKTSWNVIESKLYSVNLFFKISHIDNNIVMVGPNGSGKSTFARSLQGKMGSNFSIISAQRLLVYQSSTQIHLESNVEIVRNFQSEAKLGSNRNLIELLRNDFSNLILALFEEKIERQKEYYEGLEEHKNSLLDSTISIWESLLLHRKIKHPKAYSLRIETEDGHEYELNSLSDGEKSVFYYIGHVLLAPKNSYIVIDEPENHLHLSICTRLWDMLEQQRADCKFIYITHNLDFAISRNNKTILWNKSFNPPFDWEVEELNSDVDIPDILLLEIIGSRKNVIFCEGDDRNSLDYKIYSRIFSNYNVIPVGSHDDVISYCKAFNRNRGLNRLEAYGIIDGDAWSYDEIQSMHSSKIMTLPYNEIENFICEKSVLEAFTGLVGSSPDAVNIYVTECLKVVDRKKEQLSTWYANSRINTYLKHNLFQQSKNIEQLKQEVENFVSSNSIQMFYADRMEHLTTDVEERNFDSLIKYVNLKKELSKGLANRYIVDNYEERIISLLDSNAALKELFVEKFKEFFPLLS